MKTSILGNAILGIITLIICDSCRKISQQNGSSGVGNSSSLPNIIFILADDVGYEVPTFDGGQSYAIPNLDEIASEGMIFNQCHAQPLCSPSRVMLMTGQYNFKNYTEWGLLSTNNKTYVNYLKNAGYATAAIGKWELDGGDNSIHTFGFDDYLIWFPYRNVDEFSEPRYKDPMLYQNARFVPSDSTVGKYSEDLYAQFAINFMTKNLNKPFFMYYALSSCHWPYEPPPTNPAFTSWVVNDSSHSNLGYFPDDLNYVDIKIGQLISALKELGLYEKTIIVFTGDNGTETEIASKFRNTIVYGGKGTTKETGTHVPLIVSWPGHLNGGSQNNDLIDFTDVFPTILDMAKIRKPGNLDGISFYPELMGGARSREKNMLYFWYTPYPNSTDTAVDPIFTKIWVQNNEYKLYNTGQFFDFIIDPNEQNPIPKSAMDSSQVAIQNEFQNVINNMNTEIKSR